MALPAVLLLYRVGRGEGGGAEKGKLRLNSPGAGARAELGSLNCFR